MQEKNCQGLHEARRQSALFLGSMHLEVLLTRPPKIEMDFKTLLVEARQALASIRWVLPPHLFPTAVIL